MKKEEKEPVKEVETYYPKNRQQWRSWLQKYHLQKQSVWLVYYKKATGMPTVKYSDAVDEALCHGWIDSTTKSLDEEKFIQFFCKRKEKSAWSKINKAKVEQLAGEGLMTEAGWAAVEKAKQNGYWSILDEAEALIIPGDLQAEFRNSPAARNYFDSLSRSDKRNMLQWLVFAKKEETRARRIKELIAMAGKNQKPKPFQ